MGRTKSILVPQVSRLWVLVLALTVLAVPALRAQSTTGAVEGVVKDASGAVLPGATVEATGPAGIVRSVSDDQGEFRFPRLLPGRYKVMATLSGFSTRESDVTVTVDKTARVEFGLAVGERRRKRAGQRVGGHRHDHALDRHQHLARADRVHPARPRLHRRGSQARSGEPDAGRWHLHRRRLGLGEPLRDGRHRYHQAADRRQGEPLGAEFMDEVQVKSAGYAAEYGGSTGGVINVVTKTGTNKLNGGVLTSGKTVAGAAPRGPCSGTTSPTPVSSTSARTRTKKPLDAGACLGGPIVRDRLWFYAGYQPWIRQTERTVNFAQGAPTPSTRTSTVKRTANLTGNPGSKLISAAASATAVYTQGASFRASPAAHAQSPRRMVRGEEFRS